MDITSSPSTVSMVIELSIAETDRPTYLPTDMCEAICPSFYVA